MYFFDPKAKNAICDGTPPTCRPKLTYMSAGSAEVPNLQTELYYLDSVMFYVSFNDN